MGSTRSGKFAVGAGPRDDAAVKIERFFLLLVSLAGGAAAWAVSQQEQAAVIKRVGPEIDELIPKDAKIERVPCRILRGASFGDDVQLEAMRDPHVAVAIDGAAQVDLDVLAFGVGGDHHLNGLHAMFTILETVRASQA